MRWAHTLCLSLALLLGLTIASGAHNGPIVDGIEHMAAAILFVDDNAQDIGGDGTNRPRSIYAGTHVEVGDNAASTGAVRVPNAAWLYGRNQANNGDVAIARVTTGNAVELGAAVVTNGHVTPAGSSMDLGSSSNDWRRLHLSNRFHQAETGGNPGPGDLAQDAEVAIYNKSDTLVFAYNNGGTMTYLTIDLDGSDTTWTHGTTDP